MFTLHALSTVTRRSELKQGFDKLLLTFLCCDTAKRLFKAYVRVFNENGHVSKFHKVFRNCDESLDVNSLTNYKVISALRLYKSMLILNFSLKIVSMRFEI